MTNNSLMENNNEFLPIINELIKKLPNIWIGYALTAIDLAVWLFLLFALPEYFFTYNIPFNYPNCLLFFLVYFPIPQCAQNSF